MTIQSPLSSLDYQYYQEEQKVVVNDLKFSNIVTQQKVPLICQYRVKINQKNFTQTIFTKRDINTYCEIFSVILKSTPISTEHFLKNCKNPIKTTLLQQVNRVNQQGQSQKKPYNRNNYKPNDSNYYHYNPNNHFNSNTISNSSSNDNYKSNTISNSNNSKIMTFTPSKNPSLKKSYKSADDVKLESTNRKSVRFHIKNESDEQLKNQILTQVFFLPKNVDCTKIVFHTVP